MGAIALSKKSQHLPYKRKGIGLHMIFNRECCYIFEHLHPFNVGGTQYASQLVHCAILFLLKYHIIFLIELYISALFLPSVTFRMLIKTHLEAQTTLSLK